MTAEPSNGVPARVIDVRADSDDAAPTADGTAPVRSKGDNHPAATAGTAKGGTAAATSETAAAVPSNTAATEVSGGSKAAPAPETEPATATTPAKPAQPQHAEPTRPASSRPAAKTSGDGGLSEEALMHVAQAKFDAQEEKLRDVTRQSMALLRDYEKLTAAECDRRMTEIRKHLVKYEMQFIRVWESQEKRRRLETEALRNEAQRCSREAESEGGKIVELREILQKERKRRKRYESYEELALEVNSMKTRADSQAEIDATTAEIARLKRRRTEVEELVSARSRRAQLLRHAVEELRHDLKQEQQVQSEVTPNAGSSVAASARTQPVAVPAPADVEVIS